MTDWIITQLQNILDNPFLAFIILFVLAAVNLFFPPTPLETATLFAGYLTGIGRASMPVVVAATTLGMFGGSYFLYYLVKAKGISILDSVPIRSMVMGKAFDRATTWFERYGIYAVFLGKLVPGMSLASVIGAGVFQWPAKTAALAFLISNLIFFTAIALTGRLLGVLWGRALPWLGKISVLIVLIVIIITGVQVFRYLIDCQKNHV